jgi:predicted SprT family Zn-dependent metalloprotease
MNRVVVNSNEEFYYANKAQQIIQAFPVIIHELCHYWQFKKNPLSFIFLQLPIIREFTI